MLESEVLDNLTEIWSTANDRYDAIKNDCESRVVRWEWFDNDDYLPYSFEPSVFNPNAGCEDDAVNVRPPGYGTSYELGIDLNDQLLVTREHLSIPSGSSFSDAFRIYEGDDVIQITYGYDLPKEVWLVERAVSLNGRVEFIGRLDWASYFPTSYLYEGERSSKIIYRQVQLEEYTKVRALIEGFIPDSAIEDQYYWDAQGIERIVRRHRKLAAGEFEPLVVVWRRHAYDDESAPDAVEANVLAALKEEASQCIAQFRKDHQTEGWYSFLLVPDPYGKFIDCAFGTEVALVKSVERFRELGYMFRRQGNVTSLRTVLRHSPWDGFYFYRFPQDGGIRLLNDAVRLFRFSPNNRDMEWLLQDVLRGLDADGYLGTGEERKNVVIGLAMGTKPAEFTRSFKVLNPREVVDRVSAEMNEARKLRRSMLLEIMSNT